MKAAHVAEYYTAYLEGSLPEALREEMARHLESCPRCAAELEETRAIVASLREMPAMPLPADFAAGVQARLANRRHPVHSWFTRLPALAGGTLAAVALALAIFYVRPYLRAPESRPVEIAEQPETSGNKEMTAQAGRSKAFDNLQPSSPTTESKPLGDLSAIGNSDTVKNGPEATARRQLSGNEVDAKEKNRTARDLAGSSFWNRDGEEGGNFRSDDVYKPTVPRKFEIPAPGGDAATIAQTPSSVLDSTTVPPHALAGPASAPGAARPPVNTPSAEAEAAPGMGGTPEPSMKAAGPPALADVISPDRTRTVGGVYAADARASAVGALALRGVALKGAEAAVTIETTAPAPTDLVVRAIEPAGGEGQGYPLSPDMRTAVFSLPLQRGGSVVEITLKAGRTERAILVLPELGGPQSSISLNAREESITAVLRRLAAAGQLIIFCPPQFIADREASLTVSKESPLAALSDLATQRGFRAIKTGSTVTLMPK